ncbi:Hypothetical predicted protein [Podarcis lilfordi]|uniref:Uncharacterized protein n=1 Tax=Podarcis lilfordi TaxID=74358 RepID=A0AA35JZT0_9SAUR|nr:Hypothetical predicted protein [Podarcis lilfordi]
MKREMTKQLYSPACGRGTGKRTRDSRDIDDTEELRCLPLAKQTKISESESTKDIFNIPVSNSFTLLAEMNDEESSVKEPFDNLPTKPSSNNNTGIHSNVCTRARESCIDEILFEHSTTLDLVARTVDYIFKYIKDIRGSLEKIISLVSLTGKDSSPDVPPEMKPLQMPRAPVLPHTSCIIPQAAGNQKSEQGEQNKKEQHSAPPHKLLLQATKICLTVCPFRGKVINWHYKSDIRRHLAELLRVTPSSIDLKHIDHISSRPQRQRVLLSFKTKKLPALIMSSRSLLMNYGILATRVFTNTKICPLLPNCLFKKKADKSEGPPIATTPTPLAADLISWIDAPLPPLTKAIHLENSTERELLLSFSQLPKLERTEITDRLDELLLCLRNSEDHAHVNKMNSSPIVDQSTQAQVVPALTTFDLQPGCTRPRDVKSGQDTVEDSTTLWSNSEAVARLDALLEANRKGCLPPALHCMFPTASADPKGPPPSILEHTLNVESMDLSLSDTPVHQNPSLQLPIIKPQSMAAAAVSGARKLPGKQATITSFFQPIVPPRRMHSQVDSAVLVPQGPA